MYHNAFVFMAEALIFCIITDLFTVKMYKNTKNDKQFDIIYKFLVTFQTLYGKLMWYIKKCGRKLKNEQKRRKRVKVF